MGFAANCGYRKLLVLSGLTKRSSLANWAFPEEYKPDYYVDNLSSLSAQEQEDFLNSFDQVLCDVDGVLWLFYDNIPGAEDALKSLKKLGKKIIFVSNNCLKSPENYCNYLKSAVGMQPMRKEMENAGLKIAEYAPNSMEESLLKFLELCVADNEQVGAVVVDVDVNINYLKLQKAATYLMRPDVIFITGGSDTKLVFGPKRTLIGPGYFHNILTDISGRKPLCLAKPSTNLNDFLKEKYKIENPSRVLFIGDSILDDMAFAANCGYKKLLVLSGLAQKDSVTNWTFPEEYKPDYYAN
ncbi:Hydrolase 6 domain containing protein, partial [Asbolus verrucosus]